jgi:uncharacterized protein YndB with AHSA1/START domain
MIRIAVAKDIAASPEVVFRAVSDFENLPNTNAEVIRIEFLGEQREGLGTRFRDVRMQGKKEMPTDLEVTEFEDNVRMRCVADTHGTIWDTLFEVTPTAKGAELRLTMDATPQKLLAKVMVPIMQGLFKKGMVGHLDSVAAYCESV